jgi:hypothetical protein
MLKQTFQSTLSEYPFPLDTAYRYQYDVTDSSQVSEDLQYLKFSIFIPQILLAANTKLVSLVPHPLLCIDFHVLGLMA